MYARVATLSTNMLFSKEQLGRGGAWGNRQKPRISETEAIRRLLDLALNCAKLTFPQARGHHLSSISIAGATASRATPISCTACSTLMASPVQPGRAAKPSAA